MDLPSNGRIVGETFKIPIIINIITIISPIVIIHGEILKSADRAPMSLDMVKSDQSSTSSPENATSSFSPAHDIGIRSWSTLGSAVKKSGPPQIQADLSCPWDLLHRPSN